MEKKITKATVKKMAKEAGVSITMVSVWNRSGSLEIERIDLPQDLAQKNMENQNITGNRYWNIPEVDRLVRKYNRQVKKLIAVLRKNGLYFRGRFLYGRQEWTFTNREWTPTDELIWNNID
jgi:DNA-binding transcriptional MerR regulator